VINNAANTHRQGTPYIRYESLKGVKSKLLSYNKR